MLTIYCGDHVTESRKNFLSHRKRLSESDVECIDIPSSDMSEIESRVLGSASLFKEKQAFFLENILSRKTYREFLKNIYKDSTSDCIVWEGTMDDRAIKRYFPKAKIIVSKLPVNVWKYLDSMYPGNARAMIVQLKAVSESVDLDLLLFMLQQRAKDLILASHDLPGKRKLADWQLRNMKSQAVRWGSDVEKRTKRLQGMYMKLFDIEKGIKTGTLPYSYQKALDILFSFYLQ